MSRVLDSAGNEYHVEEVQRYCLLQLELFAAKSHGPFGWPMVVQDWNKEGRQTDCIEFHRSWLRNEENIIKAIQRSGLN